MPRKAAKRQFLWLTEIPEDILVKDRTGEIWEFRHGIWGYRDRDAFWNACHPGAYAARSRDFGPFIEYTPRRKTV